MGGGADGADGADEADEATLPYVAPLQQAFSELVVKRWKLYMLERLTF